MAICISPSLSVGNRYFIFREGGVEVKIDIVRNKIPEDFNLSAEEVKYFKENVLIPVKRKRK